MIRFAETIFVTADKQNVVPGGDPGAAFLLGRKGVLRAERDLAQFRHLLDVVAGPDNVNLVYITAPFDAGTVIPPPAQQPAVDALSEAEVREALDAATAELASANDAIRALTRDKEAFGQTLADRDAELKAAAEQAADGQKQVAELKARIAELEAREAPAEKDAPAKSTKSGKASK